MHSVKARKADARATSARVARIREAVEDRAVRKWAESVPQPHIEAIVTGHPVYTVCLSVRAEEALARLLAGGLHGRNASEVIARLVDDGLRVRINA